MRHLDCNHPTTPGAREACRMLYRMIAAAERRQLKVEWIKQPDEDDSRYVFIWQVSITNPRRSSMNDRLLLTCSRGTPRTTLCRWDGTSERTSWRRAFICLDVLAI